MKHIAIVFNEDDHLVAVHNAPDAMFHRTASDWCTEHYGDTDARFRIEIWEIGGKRINTLMWEMDPKARVVHIYSI